MRSVDMEFGLVPRRDHQGLPIQGGRVSCPAQGEIGVEACLGCWHLRGISHDEEGVVICELHLDRMVPYVPGKPRDWDQRPKR